MKLKKTSFNIYTRAHAHTLPVSIDIFFFVQIREKPDDNAQAYTHHHWHRKSYKPSPPHIHTVIHNIVFINSFLREISRALFHHLFCLLLWTCGLWFAAFLCAGFVSLDALLFPPLLTLSSAIRHSLCSFKSLRIGNVYFCAVLTRVSLKMKDKLKPMENMLEICSSIKIISLIQLCAAYCLQQPTHSSTIICFIFIFSAS